MLRKIRAVLKIGIIESGQGSLRDNGVMGLIINILSCLVTTLLPFLLFFFKVFGENWGIIWYAHFAIFFEIIGVLIANDRELTDYRSMSLFPLNMIEVLFLRFIRKFLNPISLFSTTLFIVSVFLGTKLKSVHLPTSVIVLCLIISIISLLILCEDVCLWKEKCGAKNILSIIPMILAAVLGVLPFCLHGKGSPVVILMQRCRGNSAWLCATALAVFFALYIICAKLPQRFFDKFKYVKNEVSHFNLVCAIISLLPVNRQLKQLMIKDYKVMIRNNFVLIFDIVLWVVFAWVITKIPGSGNIIPNEWMALCYAGVVMQIYSAILQKPFAGDAYSGWITLLSPVKRKYILLSKNLVILISNVFWFIPMSVFVAIISDDFTIEKCGLWFFMYLCLSFPMATALNSGIISTKMRKKVDGKKAFLRTVWSFVLKLIFYAIVITTSIIYQMVMDYSQKLAHLLWVIIIPLCIIFAFIWAMGLESQGKKINKYTQAITENLAVSKG